MILVVGMVLIALTVPLAGGRLDALGELRLRHTWLVAVALGIQVAIISIAPGAASKGVLSGVHLGTYALTGVFLAVNRQVTGSLVMAAGGALNLVAIAANGGVMPAREAALAMAGRPVASEVFVNSGVVGQARLAWLGDVFAVPAGWPLANVFSVGDVLLVVGGFVALHATCGSRLVPARWHARPMVGEQTSPRGQLLTRGQPLS